eukprot:3164267-Pleurochrysis_carterae.AAC.10
MSQHIHTVVKFENVCPYPSLSLQINHRLDQSRPLIHVLSHGFGLRIVGAECAEHDLVRPLEERPPNVRPTEGAVGNAQ